MATLTIQVSDSIGGQQPGLGNMWLIQIADSIGSQDPTTSPPSYQTTQPPDRRLNGRWGPGPGRRFRTSL